MRRGVTGYVLKDRISRLVPIIRGAMRQVDERAARRRAELWSEAQNRILKLIATGASLTEALGQLALTVESQAPGMQCSILLLDADGVHLRSGPAPSLPEPYSRALDGLAIGPAVWCCGTAAYRKERVVVTDIATDPLCAGYRDLAARYGLRACWSTPILSREGDLLGAFANYFRIARGPTQAELDLVASATPIARIAVEKRRDEEEMLRAQERLDLALEGSDLAFFDWNVTTGRMELSKHWSAILGGTGGTTVTTIEELESLIHPDDRAIVSQKVAQLLNNKGGIYDTEHRVRSRSGEWKWILSRGKVSERDAHGRALRVVGTNADITGRKEGERLKNEFFATVNHELRTPLNAIIGMVYLAQLSSPKPELRGQLDRIRGAANTLLDLINDILDYSKIEAGQLNVEAVDLVLDDWIEEIVNVTAGFVQAKGLEFIVDIAADVPSVIVTDPLRLKQVLVNLLSNAVKFTSRGEITLSVRSMRVEGSRTVLEFAVRDTGIGIPHELQAQLFQAFSQVEISTARLYGGTGLGLAISKRLVELMGGSIELRSAPGQGTTVSLLMPCGRGVAPAAQARKLGSARALVVDGNETANAVLCGLLRELGCEASAAADAAGAAAAFDRARASSTPFDIVLLDSKAGDALPAVAMTGRPGNGKARRNPRVVWLCDWGTERRGGAGNSHIHQTLFKPVTRSALWAVLDTAAGRERKRLRHDHDKPLSGLHALLAEDNELNREIATRILEQAGATVTGVGDGKQAVEAALSRRFDIVLMDIQMPRMGGLEATRLLRERFDVADLPIVALTASVLSSDRERFTEAGMNDYHAKPIHPRRLVEVVQRWARGLPEEPSNVLPTSGDERPVPQALAVLRTAGFDVQRGLSFVGNDPAQYRRVLARFASESTAVLRWAAREAVAGKEDRQGAVRELHTLAGTAGILGFDELRKAALSTETAIGGSAGDADAALLRVESLLQGALDAVKSVLGAEEAAHKP